MYKSFHSSKGKPLSLNGSPLWYSSLRPCRKMWDLKDGKQLELARLVRDAIRMDNEDVDLLKDCIAETGEPEVSESGDICEQVVDSQLVCQCDQGTVT